MMSNLLQSLHLYNSKYDNVSVIQFYTDWTVKIQRVELLRFRETIGITINIDNRDDALLLQKNVKLMPEKYMVSMMNYSKLIIPSYVIYRNNVNVQYSIPPPQGMIFEDKVVFSVFSNDPGKKMLDRQKFYAAPIRSYYPNAVDMDFVVQSNYVTTPVADFVYTTVKYIESLDLCQHSKRKSEQ